MTRIVSGVLRARRGLSPWPALAVAITYVSVSTADVSVGPVPLKFLVTVAALAVWLLSPRRNVPERTWLAPILVFGVGVPLYGVGVAAVRTVADDPAQSLGLSAAVTEASRFVYVLLALPLIDWYRQSAARGPAYASRIWMWPAALVAAVTWGLFALHLAGVDFAPTGRFGPFSGDIGVDPVSGSFRAFMVVDVVLIPAVTLLFARISTGRLRPTDAGLFALMAGALVLSHTRGLWVGVIFACGSTLVVKAALDARRLVRWVTALVGVGLAVAVVGQSAPSLAAPVVDRVTGGSAEQSADVRIEQEPELVDGFLDYPVSGAGLGGVLPSGYQRSVDTPWSYELAILQLLFQLGVVGVAALAWLPLTGLRQVASRLSRYPEPFPVGAVAGACALMGFLVTCASNPYLVTSAGTLTVGIAVALLAQSQERHEGRAGGSRAHDEERGLVADEHGDGLQAA